MKVEIRGEGKGHAGGCFNGRPSTDTGTHVVEELRPKG